MPSMDHRKLSSLGGQARMKGLNEEGRRKLSSLGGQGRMNALSATERRKLAKKASIKGVAARRRKARQRAREAREKAE